MITLVDNLRHHEQDFEFYPTTNEIINALVLDIDGMRNRDYDLRAIGSALDVGAGHGKVLRALSERANISALYAIEKSPILCQQLDDDVFIVGSDFHEQSLVAKQVDVTFCNPPYSEFEEWATKILRESSSKLVYLVIPERWERSADIANAIAFREAKAEVVGRFDFLNAEDRAARAKVHLIRVRLCVKKDDAFDRFFAQEFADLRTKWDAAKSTGQNKEEGARRNPKLDALVVGQNYPDMLVGLYNEDLEHVRKNYDLVKQLDVDLLREFDVSPERIMGCLKARLAGLRNTYWQELFSHMKSVTNRLTSKKRQAMLNTLNGAGHVDFTVGNIHAVIIWVMKNANSYITAQLLETFDSMVEKANVRNYVSNTRAFVYDQWRYNGDQAKPSHIALEFRLVLQRMGGIRAQGSYNEGLDESAANFLGDLMTVAYCMGFDCKTNDVRLTGYQGRKGWTTGTREEFFCRVDGREEVLFDVRAFLNRNIHIRLNQKFALALNVEVGRLRGWVKSGQEAADELKDKAAAKYFGSTIQIGPGSLPMLAA